MLETIKKPFIWVLTIGGALFAFIWSIVTKNKRLEQELAKSKAEQVTAETMIKLEGAKNEADKLESDYIAAKSKYDNES